MSGFLVDTNVLSELRKGRRANANVQAWFARTPGSVLWTSVLVVGEIRKGIEAIRRRDAATATALDQWLERVMAAHSGRILPIDTDVAIAWGRLSSRGAVPVIDGLLAATAATRGLVLVTRNVRDLAKTGVPHLDPFAAR